MIGIPFSVKVTKEDVDTTLIIECMADKTIRIDQVIPLQPGQQL